MKGDFQICLNLLKVQFILINNVELQNKNKQNSQDVNPQTAFLEQDLGSIQESVNESFDFNLSVDDEAVGI